MKKEEGRMKKEEDGAISEVKLKLLNQDTAI
jgi:hypothetical protein